MESRVVSAMDEDVEKPLDISRELIFAGFTQNFSDMMSRRFLDITAVTIGATVNQLSFLSAFRSLLGNILQIPFGRIADNYSKRKIIAVSRILGSILLFYILTIENPSIFIYFVLGINILANVAVIPWNSLLGDYTSEHNRGATIGRINSITGMGGTLALLIAVFLNVVQPEAATRETFNNLILFSAITSFISGILILNVKEKSSYENKEQFHWSKFTQNKVLLRYLVLNFFYGFSMSFSWPLFDYIAINKLGIEVWQISAISLVSMFSSIFFQRFGSGLMDKYGRRPFIVISRVLMAISPASYALASSWIQILVTEAIVGLAMGAWMSSEPTYIIDIAPRNLRATYLASSTTFFGIASFFGSMAGGYYSDNFSLAGFSGVESGLLVSAILRAVVGLVFMSINETKPKE